MSGRLEGKVAVVTGAASGFGEGIVRRFAEEGARIVVADLNGDGAAKVASEIGAAAVPVMAELRDIPLDRGLLPSVLPTQPTLVDFGTMLIPISRMHHPHLFHTEPLSHPVPAPLSHCSHM